MKTSSFKDQRGIGILNASDSIVISNKLDSTLYCAIPSGSVFIGGESRNIRRKLATFSRKTENSSQLRLESITTSP